MLVLCLLLSAMSFMRIISVRSAVHVFSLSLDSVPGMLLCNAVHVQGSVSNAVQVLERLLRVGLLGFHSELRGACDSAVQEALLRSASHAP